MKSSEQPSSKCTANPDDLAVQPPRGPRGPMPGPHVLGLEGRIAIVQAQVLQLWLITDALSDALYELLFGHTAHLVWLAWSAAGPALAVGVTWPRVIAAALSLGLTAGLMVLCKSPHPLAGATTLIISLGILTQPRQLVLLLVAVVLLTIQAFAINRLAGIPYPLGNPLKEPERSPEQSK